MKIILLLSVLMVGCASQNALNQPEKKDLSLFSEGVQRELVIVEFGAPQYTEELEDGSILDIYGFVQGYSGQAGQPGAIAHGAADLLTIGIWSAAGSQIEEKFNGNRMGYKVIYRDGVIVEVEKLVDKPLD